MRSIVSFISFSICCFVSILTGFEEMLLSLLHANFLKLNFADKMINEWLFLGYNLVGDGSQL